MPRFEISPIVEEDGDTNYLGYVLVDYVIDDLYVGFFDDIESKLGQLRRLKANNE